jgi:hypothetical protein
MDRKTGQPNLAMYFSFDCRTAMELTTTGRDDFLARFAKAIYHRRERFKNK